MNRDSLNLLFNEYLDLGDSEIGYGLTVTLEESTLGPVHDEVEYFGCDIYEVGDDALQYMYDMYDKDFGNETFYVVRTMDRREHLEYCRTLEEALDFAKAELSFFLSDYDKSMPVECVFNGDEKYYAIYEEALKEMN